jgi:membrane protein DedA with SNARE-associated domain
MPPELAAYITHYGYLAIFSLVFLQEIGVPNPVPNEFVLLFAGYLTSIHVLSLTLVLLSVVAADFIGTTILFFVFYFFGKAIMNKKPKWIPIKMEHIEYLSERILEKNWWGIYLGRLIPYVRGYTSVAAGLIQIKPRTFILTVILSAVTWSGGYALGGHFMGTYWEKIAQDFGGASSAFYAFLTLLLVIVFGLKLKKYVKNHRNAKNGVSS